ncbi:hypothetical protein GGI07_000407 [Coemansia sp. Benny D115]|nr:hypothetical protein GGI07_000407 [Coemansia sp. Benny D115]
MQDARDTLKGLGGKTNEVITAVCLVIEPTDGASAASGITQIAEVESTEVVFADLDDDIINAYVDTGEPMDKAGSYAYQSLACFFIKEIKGDFYNVMGFPCAKFYQILVSLHQKGYF